MDLQERKKIWRRFIEEGVLSKGLPPLIAHSWKECRQKGIDPWHRKNLPVDLAHLNRIRQKNRLLLQVAEPIMQSVHEIVRESHSLLALMDSTGCVLRTIGDDTILQHSENIFFHPGSVWRNDCVGTNGPGLALEYDRPIQLVGAEHYCADQHNWSCSAAPIHGNGGQVIGVLDLSGSADAAHPHTLALVVACAFSIEQTLRSYPQSHFMKAAANGLPESILLLNDTLKVRWANATAYRELGLSHGELSALDFRRVLPQIDWSAMNSQAKSDSPVYMDDLCVVLPKKTYHFSAALSPTCDATGQTYTLVLRRQEHLFRSVNRVAGNQATYTFQTIYTDDSSMQEVIAEARQYAHYDSSLLIEGESGTGKELFAQAIHAASPRCKGPFVAVNCASLPRDLIESELFGYEKGSFTGALREGNPGKFELADHGTLFLDEIGEMPLEFQAKLLRAVETLCIRRIGGKEEKKLDVRVISATNRCLESEVAKGTFRSDLYYRLNILKLSIPPLRSRPKDIRYCANLFLKRFNSRYHDRTRQLSPAALKSLQEYAWPGNVRELQNCIERAFYTSSSAVIMPHDLSLRDRQQPVTSPVLKHHSRDDAEKTALLQCLEKSFGKVSVAAASYGVSRATFYRLCQHYGIRPKEIRRRHP